MILLRSILVTAAICCALLLGAGAAHAHNQAYAIMKVVFPTDDRYEISLNFHLAALLLGEPQAHLSSDARARWAALSLEEIAQRVTAAEAFLSEAIEVYADGERLKIEHVAFPAAAALREDGLMLAEEARPSEPLSISGRLPVGVRLFSIAAPAEFTETLLSLQTGTGGTVAQVLGQGELSHPFALGGSGGRAITIVVPEFLVTLQQYVFLGFEHILPKGFDHILFVLALFLLTPQWKALAIQITAFTLAHSVTLTLAVFGIISVPAVVVEPLIAATIVAVALDNVFSNRLRRWRTAGVFLFGLLHGIGFAGVLRALGLPAGEEALALVSFNLGVELGQIAVLCIAFLSVGWLRRREWFRTRVGIPASLAIAATGLVWMIERLFVNLPTGV